MKHDRSWKESLQRELLKWFEEYQRDLPWRIKKSLYRIWVSEIMLQQTQVATVIDYYKRFMRRFPSVSKLAEASEEEVLKHWEGLGYYRRARQLHAAAKVIVEDHGGKFPRTFEDVLALPGIGRYTAGAVLSIALDQKQPILEGNTIRLFARLMAMKSDPRTSANQKALWEFSESILPASNIGDFNQALMELGSQVCMPRNPTCLICPIRDLCPTRIKGLQDQIPVAAKKMKYEKLHEAAFVIERKGKVLVRHCQPGERWAGLWDFPRVSVPGNNDGLATMTELVKELTGLSVAIEKSDLVIKHAVTRFRITLDCYFGQKTSGRIRAKSALKWVTIAELESLPLSTTGRKVANHFFVQ